MQGEGRGITAQHMKKGVVYTEFFRLSIKLVYAISINKSQK